MFDNRCDTKATMASLIKLPSAWMPIAASVAMLAFILIMLAVSGAPTTPAEDEGVGAHIFQLWLVYEFFAILFFSAKWIPRQPKPAMMILAIQIIAVSAACAPVRILGL